MTRRRPAGYGAASRRQRTDDRDQIKEEKGKKVRGWEGVKVRKKSAIRTVLPFTFSLLPIDNQLDQPSTNKTFQTISTILTTKTDQYTALISCRIL
jgi:hypothetical protein